MNNKNGLCLCDGLEAKIITARAVALVQEHKCVQSLILLAVIMEVLPDGIRSSLLDSGISRASIDEHIAAEGANELAEAEADEIPLSVDIARLIEHSLELAKLHKVPCAGVECVVEAILLEPPSAVRGYFLAVRFSEEKRQAVLELTRARLKRIQRRSSGGSGAY